MKHNITAPCDLCRRIFCFSPLVASLIKKTLWVSLALIPLLFGSCRDPFSIGDFIKENTSTARVLNCEVHPESSRMPGSSRAGFRSTYVQSLGGPTIVFYVEPQQPGQEKPYRNIELELALYNPQGYSLTLEPDYRVYYLEEEQVTYPDGDLRKSVTAIQTSANVALLIIKHAYIGERYDVKLNVSMSDGSRVFDTYTNIPAIVFNTPLDGPRGLELHAGTYNGDLHPKAHWEITQLEDAHPGINRINLLFQEEVGNSVIVDAKFVYEKVGGKWYLDPLESSSQYVDTMENELTILDKEPTDTHDTFEVYFPMPMNSSYISYVHDNKVEVGSAPYKQFNFTVTIRDQYGLDTLARFDDGATAQEQTFLKSLTVKGYDKEKNLILTNDKFYESGKINYPMKMPFDVEYIRIEHEKSVEFPDQTLKYGSVDLHSPSGEYYLPQGNPLNFNLVVTYIPEPAVPPANYTLYITRLSPDTDSKLDGISVNATSITPIIMPVFNPLNTGVIYMVNVQSSDNNVTLNALLPEMDPGHESHSTLYDPILNPNPKAPSIVTLLKGGSEEIPNENPKNFVIDPTGNYKGVDGKWTLPLVYGPNPFTLRVQPEEGPFNTYYVTIIRAPETGDDGADLANLTIKAPDNAGDVVPLIPGPYFNNDFTSFEVNVRYGHTSIAIVAELSANNATVTSIRDFKETNTLHITKNGNTYSANMTGLQQGGSYPVTITVTSPIASREYHLLVNCMLPAVSGISPSEEDGAVTLTWNRVNLPGGVPGNVSYELYYHTANIIDTANIIGTATKWGGSPTGTGATRSARVAGLTNAQEYHFWLRAMNGTIPGEWNTVAIQAMPKSDYEHLANIATPGIVPIIPLDFEPAKDTYTVIVPSDIGQVEIQGIKGEANQTLSYNPVNQTVILANPGSSTGTVSITVTSHSGITKEYTVNVYRMLPGPTWATLGDGFYPKGASEEVTLQWNGFSPTPPLGNIAHYEVYYTREDGTAPPFPPNVNLGEEYSGPNFPRYVKTSGTETTQRTKVFNTGLFNGTQYYFWVRAWVNNNGIPGGYPGEWSAVGTATPKSDTADLADIATSAGTFVSAGDTYTITVPYSTGNVPIAITKGNKDQQINYTLQGGSGTHTSPSDVNDQYVITLAPGTSSVLTIAVRSQDNEAARNYTVTVNRRPETPPAFGVGAKHPSVNLSWNSSTGATAYELYYSRTDNPVSLPVGQGGTPAGATTWDANISGSSASIPGLTSQLKYHFYLRSKAVGGPGGIIYSEWATESAIPFSDMAILSSLTPAYGVISPALNTAVDDNYYLIEIPSTAPGSISIGITAAHGGTPNPASISLSGNSSATITVTSLDTTAEKTYRIHSQSAGISVNFALPPDRTETIDLGSQAAISWVLDTPITITASSVFPAGYTLQWYNGNVPIANETGSSLVTSAREFSLGRNFVTLRITAANGTVYSKSVSFTVAR